MVPNWLDIDLYPYKCLAVCDCVHIYAVMTGVIVYMAYKGYRKRKSDVTISRPVIVFENSAVLPFPNKVDDDDASNLSEIPTIRYEKPPTTQSVKKSSAQSKPRKNHRSERVVKRSQEVFKWNRSYSAAHVKKNFSNNSRIPSCYPIGEYVGSLSDNEGDMYDHVNSPSNTGKRRSMSISDLPSGLKEVSNFSLQVPSFLGNIHAKHDPKRSKPKSSPPAVEMDSEMTDLYDSTLRRSTRDRSNTLPPITSSNVRLSGMAISLDSHDDLESTAGVTKRESTKSLTSVRPVTQYVNSEIVEKHRESVTSNTADDSSRLQLPLQQEQCNVNFRGAHEEEPAYVTMKPAKRSLPNLESYFTQRERSPVTKPLSLHDNPVNIGPPIELASLEALPHHNSIDIDHISDSEA